MSDKVNEAISSLVKNAGVSGYALYMALGMGDMQAICHTLAYNAGWWDRHEAMAAAGFETESFVTKHDLIHSELSEALEGMRKGKNDDHLPHRKAVEVELADAVIRIMDLAGAMELDMAGAIIEKLAYNQQRADHKKENRNADGGKKF